MTTPTRQQIKQYARELYATDQFRRGCPELGDINPTVEELKESGCWTQAISELMRDQSRHLAEQWGDYAEKTETLRFSIDVATALKSGVYTSGTRGCGKSDLNMMLTDDLKMADVIVCVFDPSRDWLKRSSIEKYVTVRPYINIEIPVESQIYDLSLLTLKQQKEFVERFNRALFDYQITHGAKWVFCVYEEAHAYFYQGVLRSNEMQYTVRLLTQGRNFRISMGLITQFSAMLDKDAMKFMEQRFFGASNEPNDTEYITRFFPKHDRENVAETLRKLGSGEFLSMNKQIIHVSPYENTTEKTEIVSNTKQKTEIQSLLKSTPQANYEPLLKAVIVGTIGLIIFLIGVH